MRDEKSHKEAVVVATYSVPHKRAVMVEFMYTATQEIIVFRPEWPPDVA